MLAELSGQVSVVCTNIFWSSVFFSLSICCITIAFRFSAHMCALIKKDMDRIIRKVDKDGY